MAFTGIVTGSVSNELISSGVQNIYSGGVPGSCAIIDGGWQYLFSGGIASYTEIDSSGRQIVSSGGTAYYTLINYNGNQLVDGAASIAIVNSGGYQAVGGKADNVTINSGGVQFIKSGGTATSTIIAGGNQTISSNSVAALTIISAGGSQTVYAGGRASSTIISSGGAQSVSGTATSTTINLGGNQKVAAGGADTTPPSVPIGLTQIVTGNKVALDWADSTDASGIKRYEIQGDSQPDLDGNPPEDERVFMTASKYNITLPDGPTYWHVRAQDNAGNWSDWSEISSFIVDSALPTVPTGLTVKLDKRTLVLDWADSTDKSGINQYELRVDEQPDFSSKFVRDIPVSESKFTKTDMEVGTFYAKVRAQDNAGKWSAWSKSASVTVVGALAVNDSVDDWVGSTDVYKLNLATAGTLNLYLEGLSGDANLALFDAKNKQLKISSAKGSAPESITNTVLAKGDYFVKVIPAAKTTDTDYTLRNTFVALPADTAANTWQAAKLAAKDISGGVDNWVGFDDPADCYRLVMTNAGTLTLGLTGLNGDVNLSLLDGTGKVLKTSANKLNASESITADLLAGTYYVNVAPVKGVNGATYTLTHAEKYCPADTAANTWQTAADIAGGVDNWVGFGDAADYYKLTMTNAGTLTLGLTGLSGDANLSLLDGTGKALKTSANKLNAPEAITADLVAGTYYVNVAPVKGVNKADYNLTYNKQDFPSNTAGNSFENAREITDGEMIHEWLGFGNKEDYYKFQVFADNSTSSGSLSGFSSNINMFAYNFNRKLVASSANPGLTPESMDSGAGKVDAGTYYVKVVLAGTAGTEYDLNFVLSLGLMFGTANPLTSANAALTDDPLKKSPNMLAS